MARYIDADKIVFWIRRVSSDGLNVDVRRIAFSDEIGRIPTADVVPKSEEGAECPTCHGTGRIGTTDWLTKNISKEQLAKEKAEAIAEHEQHIKQDYAREIFEEIRNIRASGYNTTEYWTDWFSKLAELKKKYTEGEE